MGEEINKYPRRLPSGLVRLAPRPDMRGCCPDCGWHNARDGHCTSCGAALVLPRGLKRW